MLDVLPTSGTITLRAVVKSLIDRRHFIGAPQQAQILIEGSHGSIYDELRVPNTRGWTLRPL